MIVGALAVLAAVILVGGLSFRGQAFLALPWSGDTIGGLECARSVGEELGAMHITLHGEGRLSMVLKNGRAPCRVDFAAQEVGGELATSIFVTPLTLGFGFREATLCARRFSDVWEVKRHVARGPYSGYFRESRRR